MNIPASQNPGQGFFGALARSFDATVAQRAWEAAITAMVAGGFSPEAARKVLDSRKTGREIGIAAEESLSDVGSLMRRLLGSPAICAQMNSLVRR